MKKVFALLLAVLLGMSGFALAERDLSYDGTVVAGETIPVSVPFGGKVSDMTLRAGSWVREGDVIASLQTTLNYAPVEGTVTGLYAEAGDSAETVTERYGATLYIEPTHRYILEATSEKAYNTSENYYLHLGERVYLSCVADGTHKGTGMVSKLTENGFEIEVTGGEFYMGENVDIFRTEALERTSRIGRGTVKRAAPVAVKGSGSILKLHVANGDFVERGEVLFETVTGVLDGLYAPEQNILCPVTGVVASVEKNNGDMIEKGDALIKVIPAESFEVQFEVPEGDLFALSEGQAVTMELYWDNAAGGTYTGTIREISHINEEQKESTDKKVYKAYVTFKPDERIRLGMTMILYPGAEAEEPAEAEPAEEAATTEGTEP